MPNPPVASQTPSSETARAESRPVDAGPDRHPVRLGVVELEETGRPIQPPRPDDLVETGGIEGFAVRAPGDAAVTLLEGPPASSRSSGLTASFAAGCASAASGERSSSDNAAMRADMARLVGRGGRYHCWVIQIRSENGRKKPERTAAGTRFSRE